MEIRFSCSCAAEGVHHCQKHMCQVDCDNPKKVPGQCCPVCDGMHLHNNHYFYNIEFFIFVPHFRGNNEKKKINLLERLWQLAAINYITAGNSIASSWHNEFTLLK